MAEIREQDGKVFTDIRIDHALLPGERRLLSETRILPTGGLLTELKGGDFKQYRRLWKLTPVDGGAHTKAEFELLVEIDYDYAGLDGRRGDAARSGIAFSNRERKGARAGRSGELQSWAIELRPPVKGTFWLRSPAASASATRKRELGQLSLVETLLHQRANIEHPFDLLNVIESGFRAGVRRGEE